MNGDEAASVPVTVHVADPDSSARLHVQITAGDETADASGDVMGFATTLNVDASKLPDGKLTVSAWTVDEAGNPSSPDRRRHDHEGHARLPITPPASAWRAAIRIRTAT